MSALQFPAARQPVVTTDPDSGVPTFTRPWFLFFQALYSRAGGSSGPTITQVLLDSDAGVGIEELQAITAQANNDLQLQTGPPLDALMQGLDGVLTIDALRTEIGDLREQVAELNKAIQALNQATSL